MGSEMCIRDSSNMIVEMHDFRISWFLVLIVSVSILIGVVSVKGALFVPSWHDVKMIVGGISCL